MTLSASSKFQQPSGITLPAWMSALIILSSIPAAGWMLNGYFHRSLTPGTIRAADYSPDDGVRKLKGAHWKITCTPAVITVSRHHVHAPATQPADGPLDFQFAFDRLEVLNSQQTQTLAQARRLASNPKLEQAMGLSAQTIAQLNKLRTTPSVEIDPDDTRRLRELFGQYESVETAELTAIEASDLAASTFAAATTDADKAASQSKSLQTEREVNRLEAARAALERSLVHLTAHIAEKQFEPTRRSAIDRAEHARLLLTPDQWKQLRRSPTR